MDIDDGAAVRSTVLACKDTNLHLSERLGALVCGMGYGLSQVSKWRREYQCVVSCMCNSNITSRGQYNLCCAEYQQDKHEAEGRGDENGCGRGRKEAAVVLRFQRMPSTASVHLRASG